MSYTTVSSIGWFGRMKNAIVGVLFGFVLILVACAILFLNERHAVRRQRALEEGRGAVVTIGAETVEAATEGKLVHLTGDMEGSGRISNEQFGVTVEAIKLRRQVEMYQWREHEHRESRRSVGGRRTTHTTYSYDKDWEDRLIDSRRFEDPSYRGKNPDSMPYKEEEWTATPITVGAFTFTSDLVDEITQYKDLPITEETAAKLPESLKEKFKRNGTNYYQTGEIGTPQIGDVRVSFDIVEPGTVSIVARQTGEKLGPFITSNDEDLLFLHVGTHTAESMFQTEIEHAKMMTWVLRGVGFFVMFFGFMLILSPIQVAADVIPVVGSVAGCGVAILGGLVGAAVSVMVIAVGWITFRPLLGVGLLAAGIVVLVLLKIMKKPSTA